MKRILLPSAASIFILLTCMAFMPESVSEKNNSLTDIVLELSESQERIGFTFEKGGINEVTLCNLEVGVNYDLSISDLGFQCTMDPTFFGKNNNAAKHLKINSSTGCYELKIQNHCNFKKEAVLSVSREEIIDTNNNNTGQNDDTEVVPITTNSSMTATQLIEDVFIGGGCFDVTNVQTIGSSQGIGSFANGGASIGFDEGVVLSSGNINGVSGPNSGEQGASSATGGGSDSDLAILTSQNINDAAGIEFDFSPTLSTIQFQFVFGSEEYCEFVGTQFNDVFGFFISGNGFNGPYSGGGENIALVPGTVTPITINTVNNVTNSQYFLPNNAGCGGVTNSADIEFDGYTVVLTATANVIPCETYHIRLVIGDGSDSIYDSAVFLNAGSFNAGGQASVTGGNANGSGVIFEDCDDGFITFTRETGDASQPLIITYTIDPASTATAGVDYVPLPTSIIIPAGQTEVTIPITVFGDAIIEGIETIILDIDNSCSCVNNTATIQISDSVPLDVDGLDDQELCGSQTLTLSPTIVGGVPPLTYSWSTGQTTPSITTTITQTTLVSVTITDDCGNTGIEDATITIGQAPTAVLSGSAEICPPGNSAATLQVLFTGDGPWDLFYTLNGVAQTPLLGITTNPFSLQVSALGTYAISQVIEDGCPGSGSGLGIVTPTILTPVAVAFDVSCPGQNDGAINTIPVGGEPPYSYSWNNPSAGVQQNPNNLPAGNYIVTVSDANGCTGVTSTTINEPAAIIASATGASVDCNNPNGATLTLTVSGGTIPLGYLWSNGSTQQNPTGITSGTYTVTVTDDAGCTTTTSALVTEDFAPPTAVANVISNINCNNPQGSLNGSGSSTGGDFIYSWTTQDGSFIGGQNSLTPTVGSGGTYELIVTNTTNGCTEVASVIVSEDTTPPDAVANAPSNIDCNNAQISLDGFGSSTAAGVSYQWTTSDGNIVSGATTLNPLVDAAGTYILTVINANNGCVNVATVSITADLTPPDADAGQPQMIGCNTNNVTLVGAFSSMGPNFTYMWTTGNGFIVSGENTLLPQVSAPGTYEILVTNTTNGCTAIDFVDVTLDNSAPVADAGTPMDLTCGTSQLNLDGSGSDSGPDITYMWTTQDGNITGDPMSINPSIDAAGTYQLVVTGGNGCSTISTVTIGENQTEPNVDPGPTINIPCGATQVTLMGNTSTTGNLTFLWTTQNGNIVSGANTLNPIVDASGTYQLTIFNNDNNCVNVASTDVTNIAILPDVDAGVDQELTCSMAQIILDGSNSATGASITYMWMTPDGNIVSGDNTINPTVDAPGTYTLLVTDADSGCTSTATVDVTENVVLPNAVATAQGALTCTVMEVGLDGNGSSTGNFTYLWTTQNGNILSGDNTLTPQVNAAGTYQILVTNTITGCTQTATVDITNDGNVPDVNAGVADDLTCIISQVTLNGSGSSGNNFTYQWTTQNGNIVSGDDSLNPLVNAAGLYQLVITDITNGCTALSTVEVDEDNVPPVAIANPINALGCTQTTGTLDGTGSSTGMGITYQWTTQNGNIVSGDDSLNPVIDAAGTYQILVTNTLTGCTEVASVDVDNDGDVPDVNAGMADDITCDNNDITLSGSGSSGADFTYEWVTQNGNIVSGANSLDPIVDAIGIYELIITNISNGCSASSFIEVFESTDFPTAIVNPSSPLGCTQMTTTLDGTGSSNSGTDFTYEWTTQNGSIVSGETTLMPVVNAAGTYVLVVTNTTNGCTQTASIDVVNDGNVPDVNAGMADDITCNNNEITLNGNGSSGADFTYEWTTQNGNILSGGSTLNPLVNAVGEYQLMVTDINNGCTAISLVTVGENVSPPDVTLDIPDPLDCNTSTVNLTGTNNDPTGNYTYTWTTQNGDIISGNNTLSPIVGLEGQYTLEIMNTDNGCVATTSIDVTIDNQEPLADAGNLMEVTCANNEITLDGSGSASGANFTYEWTTQNGSIISGADSINPLVGAAGTYQILVTDLNNGCTAISEVVVDEDFDDPVAVAGQTQTLSCSQTSLQLNGNGSSFGNEFIYEWTTQNGSIISGDNTLTPEINAAGDYQLQVTNTDNGCINTSTVTIEQDSNVPNSSAGDDNVLNCDITTLTLDGSNSSSGIEFSYEWTTQNGNIVSGANTINPLIDMAGDYQLVVTNNTNGCTAPSSLTIVLDETTPTSEAGVAQSLSCTNNEVTLDGVGSSTGTEYTYQWVTQNGNIVSGENTLTPVVNATGTYELIVTFLGSGCTTSDFVDVNQDSSLPTADAGDGFEITCNAFDGTLDASNSTTGADIIFEWTTQDGNIVSGENTLTPLVDAAGVYQLILTNATNGCTAISAVTVVDNNNEPTAEAGITLELNCNDEMLTLSGTTTDTSSTLIYEWTTPDGNIVSGENTLNPEINLEGTYQLMITNTATGCVSTDDVIITSDFTTPIADAGATDELNCTQPFATLDGNGSSTGVEYIYLWTTQNGNIVSGENTLNPDVNMAGDYELLVTNIVNGCTSIEVVSITENINEPDVSIAVAADLTCDLTAFELDGSASSTGTEFTYQWTTTDGNIVSGDDAVNPMIDEPGTYVLVVTNTTNNCSATSQIVVDENVIEPTSNAGVQGQLTCAITQTQLDGSASSTGANFIYLWTTTTGSIISGETILTPTVGGTGTYELIVTNTITGCTSSSFTDVASDGNLPDVAAAPMGMLTCSTTTIDLNGNGSSTGADFTYTWTTVNGNIVSGETTLFPTVNQTGDYTLIVTNITNGCSDEVTIIVNEDIEPPVAVIDQTGSTSLDCINSSLILDGSGSQPFGNVSYAWTTIDGNIVSGGNTANPEIDDDGEYILTITNLTNGCTETQSIIIDQDLSVPQGNIVQPIPLTCNITELTLEGTLLSVGTNFSYQWTTTNGNIVSDGTTLNPTVDEPGLYQLIITDLNSNCDNQFSITVSEDVLAPDAEAGVADNLDCQVTSVSLNGSASSFGNNITYTWTTTNGNIVSGATTTSPVVDAEGTYTLLVTNNQNGCTAIDAVVVDADASAPSGIIFTIDEPECHDDPGSIIIETVDGGTPPYLYSIDGDNFYSGHIFTLDAGDYTLYAQDASGCETQTSFIIPELDPVSIVLENEVTIDLGDTYQIEATTNIPTDEIESIRWSPDAFLSASDILNPVVENLFEGLTYTVTITNIYGCKVQASITVNVDKSRAIYIPNVFSPGTGNENDIFMIYAGDLSQIKQVNTFLIFDRWGEVVHRAENFMPMDPDQGWDGTFKGKTMNPQVFVYWAEIEFIDGIKILYKGDVALKK